MFYRQLFDPYSVERVISDINATFIQHPDDQRLAKRAIFTKGKTAELTCLEVVDLLT